MNRKRSYAPCMFIRSRKSRRGGSSLVYVILLITFLSVFSCGYMAVSRYNMKSALAGRRYMQARLAARTIHRSFSEAVSSGNSAAMNEIWNCFDEDCQEVRQRYDEMTADSEEDGEDESRETGDGMDEEAVEQEDRWERYLYHALGQKEYVMRGAQALEDDSLTVNIVLSAKPLDGTAQVHTQVEYGGYAFSMGADIVFDHSDGAVLTIGPRRGRSHEMEKIRLNGNGVYRYYEYEQD